MLWFSDFHRHGVFTFADGVETGVATVDGQPSGLGWMPDGTLLIVSMTDRRLLRMFDDGTLREHADLGPLAPWHCNDMVVSTDGTVYVGNFGFDLEGGATPGPTVLIRVSPAGSDGRGRRAQAEMPGLAPDGCCLDAEGRIWFADPVNNQAARVVEGGEITDTIPFEEGAFACALGGHDRRTLHVLTAPGSRADEVAGKGLGAIHTVRVDVPGAGLP